MTGHDRPARRSLSLRSRLLAAGAVVTVVLVAVSATITVLTQRELIAQVDARLMAFAPVRHDEPHTDEPHTDESYGGPGPAFGDRGEPRPDGPYGSRGEMGGGRRGEDRVSDAYVGVVAPDGTVRTVLVPNVDVDVSRFSPPAITGIDRRGADRWFASVEAEDGSSTYRVLAQRFGDTVTVTALPLDAVRHTITRLVTVEVAGTATIVLMLAVVGWWVLHLGIRPLRDMTETATRIAGGDLTVRAPETTRGTEAGTLAVALNRMLGHIEQAFAERAEADARLRRFVADASHELRTPITTIRGYAELYRHGGLDDRDALDDAMRRTEQEAARMGRLVEDMLTLAKFDEQRPLEQRPVDLVALVADAVTDARAVQPGRPLRFTTEVTTAVVGGDADRLRQAVGNVMGNALVHTDPEVPVTVHLSVANRDVVVAVHDEGPGMEPDVAARATERFYRADPARARNRGGSGLGLSIVAATVAAHGGTIEVDSAPGSGTTVTLRLPLSEPLASDTPDASDAPDTPGTA